MRPITKPKRLMLLLLEGGLVYCHEHVKHAHTLLGQHLVFLNANVDGIQRRQAQTAKMC